MEDRYEAARDVMRRLEVGPAWEAAMEPGMPPELREVAVGFIDAYRRADLDLLLEQTDPDIEIVQVPEIPDSRTYRGHEGLIDALLDWPRQWEDFRVEPRRIFGVPPHSLIVVALHRGRAHSVDIEVEDEIVFCFRQRYGLVTRWDMFLTVDEALGHAAEGGADAGDDRAAERHGRERA